MSKKAFTNFLFILVRTYLRGRNIHEIITRLVQSCSRDVVISAPAADLELLAVTMDCWTVRAVPDRWFIQHCKHCTLFLICALTFVAWRRLPLCHVYCQFPCFTAQSNTNDFQRIKVHIWAGYAETHFVRVKPLLSCLFTICSHRLSHLVPCVCCLIMNRYWAAIIWPRHMCFPGLIKLYSCIVIGLNP